MKPRFAGVHQLCAPLLAWLETLPAPQRAALRVALGLAAGDPPGRFLISLAALSLLSAAAEERPLLCIVDDAQWLDAISAQILAFAARRLMADSVALVFAVRDPAEVAPFEGLPQLKVEGLPESDARALLARALPGRLDARVRDRVLAETRGNPLALIDLPHGSSAAELAGGFELPIIDGSSDPGEAHYQRRIKRLPEPTRQLLLLGAPAGVLSGAGPSARWEDETVVIVMAFDQAGDCQTTEIAEDANAAIGHWRILECVPARNTSARSSS